MATVVESGSVIVAGSSVIFQNTLTKDSVTYDLTGKSVVATIRREDTPGTVIDASLEDEAVTLVTPATGVVSLTLSVAQTTLLAPPSYLAATSVVYCLLQYRVTTDNFYPSLLRFGVRLRLD